MKQSTKCLLLIVLTQFATCGAWMCMHLASMWLEISHGLNPWIALPLATVLGLIPYVVHSLWLESDRPTKFDLETIELPIKPKPKREWLNHSTEDSNDH
jgi:hypothetical protein